MMKDEKRTSARNGNGTAEITSKAVVFSLQGASRFPFIEISAPSLKSVEKH
jgi:hypothetical protein